MIDQLSCYISFYGVHRQNAHQDLECAIVILHADSALQEYLGIVRMSAQTVPMAAHFKAIFTGRWMSCSRGTMS
jgi:hypothetical protein